MIVRKNISIEPAHLRRLEPLIEQRGGNLSTVKGMLIRMLATPVDSRTWQRRLGVSSCCNRRADR